MLGWLVNPVPIVVAFPDRTGLAISPIGLVENSRRVMASSEKVIYRVD
jgi:hypothetical protein